MKERDQELDRLLTPLSKIEPTTEQIKKWQSLSPRRFASSHSGTKSSERLVKGLQLAAACLVGFIVGLYVKGAKLQSENSTVQVASSATIEVVYTKSE